MTTTRTKVKTRVDPKTGDIIRTSQEITNIYEVIDAKTGKVKDRIVSEKLFSTTPNAAKKLREEMIERITKLVQDLEIPYACGNALIGKLKNFKVTKNVNKTLGKKQFIPDKIKLEDKYDKKHGTELYEKKTTLESLGIEIGIMEEILNNAEKMKLELYWKERIREQYESLKMLKLKEERDIANRT